MKRLGQDKTRKFMKYTIALALSLLASASGFSLTPVPRTSKVSTVLCAEETDGKMENLIKFVAEASFES